VSTFRRLLPLGLAPVVLCCLLWTGTAKGTLLFYDGFDGTDGTALTAYDSGYSKDVGPSGTATIDDPGLVVSGKDSAGNSLYLTQTGSGFFSYSRGFTETTISTLYASAFFKADAIPNSTTGVYGIFVDLPVTKELTNNTIGERDARFGIRNFENQLTLVGWVENGGMVDLLNISAESAYQIVWKYVYNSDTSRVSVYAAVNPEAGVEPTWISITGPGDYLSIERWYVDTIRVQTNINTATGWIDEIRVGTTYDDVVVASSAAVPVPATIWLLGAGLAGIAGIRKRSKK